MYKDVELVFLPSIAPKGLSDGILQNIESKQIVDWTNELSQDVQYQFVLPYLVSSTDPKKPGDDVIFFTYESNKPHSICEVRYPAKNMDSDDIMLWDKQTQYHPAEKKQCKKVIAFPEQIKFFEEFNILLAQPEVKKIKAIDFSLIMNEYNGSCQVEVESMHNPYCKRHYGMILNHPCESFVHLKKFVGEQCLIRVPALSKIPTLSEVQIVEMIETTPYSMSDNLFCEKNACRNGILKAQAYYEMYLDVKTESSNEN